MSSSVEILKEAFFDTDHVFRAKDQTDQYTVGFSDNAQNMWIKFYLITSHSKIIDVKYEEGSNNESIISANIDIDSDPKGFETQKPLLFGKNLGRHA